jgi:hypothetical protein
MARSSVVRHQGQTLEVDFKGLNQSMLNSTTMTKVPLPDDGSLSTSIAWIDRVGIDRRNIIVHVGNSLPLGTV